MSKFIVVTPLAGEAAHFTPPVTLESAVNTCSSVPNVKTLTFLNSWSTNLSSILNVDIDFGILLNLACSKPIPLEGIV